MSDTTNIETIIPDAEKPVQASDDVKFPPFPDPTNEDFEEEISEEEREYYKSKFKDLNTIKSLRLHCTACDRHLGCSARNEARMRTHPMLRTLMCHTCHSFYNSGEFDKGDDGSELYCRWCGQGGQVYCCSDCPHVFCAKCIKRNLGVAKIKEIENTDDWKCFKCNSKCLWDLRAMCWALLRYCDQKNKIAYSTQDPELKELYQKDCSVDHAECCKNKGNRRKEKVDLKKKDAENSAKKAASIISKIPPTIQVKKFASINLEDSPKQENLKKPQKRPVSPKNKYIAKPAAKMINPMTITPFSKKMRMVNPPIINPIRIHRERPSILPNYVRPIRPKPPPPLPIILNNQYNGFNNSGMYNNMVVGDNINLSLESLTQGLDMTAVAQLGNSSQDDDVVCTPDFPLEPLCEVTEDNADDDVQCITPAPIAGPKLTIAPPPLIPRLTNTLTDLSSDNIIQMTENDVTVNAATGGLKFRVDPQTLSSNKMYRLPDGRIFAINANPNMPGGYSATIVAVTDNNSSKAAPKGATYAAKLNSVPPLSTPTPPSKPNRNATSRSTTTKRSSQINKAKNSKARESPRECDLNVPVEWYRYNLIDAIDAVEYSLSRLQKLKKEATTMHLRTRNVNEMRNIHKSFERLLNTSATRFNEIRDNLNKEMKHYLVKKMNITNDISDDDDDVEILNDLDDIDDPIFIDENSVDSQVNETNGNKTPEVDLTITSEHNESGNKSTDQSETFDKDPLIDSFSIDKSIEKKQCVTKDIQKENETNDVVNDKQNSENKMENINTHERNEITQDQTTSEKSNSDKFTENTEFKENEMNKNTDKNGKESNEDSNLQTLVSDEQTKISDANGEGKESEVSEDKIENSDVSMEKVNDVDTIEDKSQDTEMTEDMIETLLKEDSAGDDADNIQSLNCLEIPDEFQEP